MITSSHSYSSTVRAELLVGNHRLALAEVGPTGCTVREPIALAPTEAEIVLQVDDDVFHFAVFLTAGISADSNLVSFERRD